MNVLSLFDGISCGQLALQRAGIPVENYFASEVDKHAIQVTQKNFPNTIQLGDVTQVSAKGLPKIDILLAGFPCQGFSSAGNKLNFKDPRSKLFFEFVRLKNELKPKWFLGENVKMRKEWLDTISNHLGVDPIFICSSTFSAQKRKRYYWTNIPFSKDFTGNFSVLKDILEKNSENFRYLLPHEIERAEKKHKAQIAKSGIRMGAVKFPTPIEEKSKCLTALTVIGSREATHVNDGSGIRLLTTKERERLQTLPENYTEGIPKTYRDKAIGNGWTVDVIAHIFKGLKDVC